MTTATIATASIRPLARHPYANCRVIFAENGDIAFVSYRTTVVVIRGDGVVEFGPVNYSNTTAKQVGWFFKEYLPGDMTYQLAKQLYRDGLVYDLRTGEVREA